MKSISIFLDRARPLPAAGPTPPHPACSSPGGHPEPRGSSRARKRNSNKKVLENIHIQIYLLGSCVVSCRLVAARKDRFAAASDAVENRSTVVRACKDKVASVVKSSVTIVAKPEFVLIPFCITRTRGFVGGGFIRIKRCL